MDQHTKYDDHFFKGVCICPCKNCTVSVPGGKSICKCQDCPTALCGSERQ